MGLSDRKGSSICTCMSHGSASGVHSFETHGAVGTWPFMIIMKGPKATKATHPHRPWLVVSHSTCPPLSSSPHANSFVIGPAVIKHTHQTSSAADNPLCKDGENKQRHVLSYCAAPPLTRRASLSVLVPCSRWRSVRVSACRRPLPPQPLPRRASLSPLVSWSR